MFWSIIFTVQHLPEKVQILKEINRHIIILQKLPSRLFLQLWAKEDYIKQVLNLQRVENCPIYSNGASDIDDTLYGNTVELCKARTKD